MSFEILERELETNLLAEEISVELANAGFASFWFSSLEAAEEVLSKLKNFFSFEVFQIHLDGNYPVEIEFLAA